MKEKQDEMIPLERSAPSDLTATLIDLAKLAQHAGTASSVAPGDLAHDLLERLMLACSARQGAIVLVTPDAVLAEQPASYPGPNSRLRLLALHEMRKEDVYAQRGYSSERR